MPPSTPFVDRETGELDTDQLLAEAVPLAKLIGLIVAIALFPFLLTVIFSEVLGLRWNIALFNLVSQFVLAVGTAIVLMYVIVRAIHLADE